MNAFLRRPAPLLVLAVSLSVLAVACGGSPPEVRIATPTPPPAATSASVVATTPAAGSACAAFAKAADPFLLRPVDKQRGLPSDYVPGDLQAIDDRWAVPGFPGESMRAPAAAPMVQMLTAAEAAGIRLRIRSSYRSYGEQARTFQFWIDQLGEAQARRESAPPGNSEHQLGTTADVISANSGTGWELVPEFASTAEGKWLAAHVAEFGFTISYPANGEAITGYVYEPWHVRYLGKPCAAEWQASGLVLVQFLDRLAAAR